MRTQFDNRVAVVTGAGSGIGQALAVALARRGARLALADVDRIGLAETASAVELAGAEVHAARLDVRDVAEWTRFAAGVKDRYGVTHQIYNNAGIGLSGAFGSMTTEDFDKVLDVNFGGVVNGTRAFLPALVESGHGAVINISSLNGIMGYSRQTAYCASKFAVRGFSEALRIEMLTTGQPVGVHVVHPGGVATNIMTSAVAAGRASGALSADDEMRARAYEAKYLKLPSEKAAQIIVDGVSRGRGRILVGRDVQLLDKVVRVLPSTYPRVVAAVLRREARTHAAVGPEQDSGTESRRPSLASDTL